MSTSRSYGYCRVSTIDQVAANQRLEILAASHLQVEEHRIVEESISGSVPAMERPAFRRLVDRMEAGDRLVVTKLDRLGRNAMDIRATLERLEAMNIEVYCLAVGKTADLTTPTGKALIGMLALMAELERDLMLERTHAGIKRARQAGVKFGRTPALDEHQQRDVAARLAAGETVSAIARQYKTSRTTIQRIRDKATPAAFVIEV